MALIWAGRGWFPTYAGMAVGGRDEVPTSVAGPPSSGRRMGLVAQKVALAVMRVGGGTLDSLFRGKDGCGGCG